MGNQTNKETQRPIFQTIKQRLQSKLDKGEYPQAAQKIWEDVPTTWKSLSNPKEYSKLLLVSIRIRLPDDTVMFTIEYLCDQNTSFLHQVLDHLGRSGMKSAPLYEILDLLWAIYITGELPNINSQEE